MENEPNITHKVLTSIETNINLSRKLQPTDLMGRILLVYFIGAGDWGSRLSQVAVQQMEKEFAPDLKVLAIYSSDFLRGLEQQFIDFELKRQSVQHPVVIDSKQGLRHSFGIRSAGSFMLIDPEGQVVTAGAGAQELYQLKPELQRLIGKWAKKLNPAPWPTVSSEKSVETSATTGLDLPGRVVSGQYQGQDIFWLSDVARNQILGVRKTGEVLISIGGAKPRVEGPLAEVGFSQPHNFVASEDDLYVADSGHRRVSRIDLKTNRVETLYQATEAGDQLAFQSNLILSLSVDGKNLVISSPGMERLWQLNLAKKTLSLEPQYSGIKIVDMKKVGKALYLLDASQNQILKFGDTQFKVKLSTTKPTSFVSLGSDVLVADIGRAEFHLVDLASQKLKRRLPLSQMFVEFMDRVGEQIYFTDFQSGGLQVMDFPSFEVGNLTLFKKDEETPKRMSEVIYPKKTIVLDVMMSDHPLLAKLNLPLGYDLTPNAPNWISLFDVTDAKNPKLILHFENQILKTKTLALPKLRLNSRFKLQGKIHYCESKSLKCNVWGIDEELPVSVEGQQTLNISISK